jgi:DNA polymerase-3 subunit delta'
VRALGLGDFERALRLALGDGPALRAGAEAFARACLAGSLAEAPWNAVLKRARSLGAAAAAEIEATTARPSSSSPRRSARRSSARPPSGASARRGARCRRHWTRGSNWSVCGSATRAASPTGVEELVLNADRLDALREDAEGRRSTVFRDAQGIVEETRRRFDMNVSEELALEQLAYRVAAL